MDLSPVQGIAQGLKENPAAFVAALAVMGLVSQFWVLLRQHQRQLDDRDKHLLETRLIHEARVGDAQKVVAVLEGLRVALLVLERATDAMYQMADLNSTKTVIRQRPPGTEGQP